VDISVILIKKIQFKSECPIWLGLKELKGWIYNFRYNYWTLYSWLHDSTIIRKKWKWNFSRHASETRVWLRSRLVCKTIQISKECNSRNGWECKDEKGLFERKKSSVKLYNISIIPYRKVSFSFCNISILQNNSTRVCIYHSFFF